MKFAQHKRQFTDVSKEVGHENTPVSASGSFSFILIFI